ncbi:cation diffusion facilitator family transporter [Halosquirtibacter laminarini]|uniref:Cation diffusion facilitator family transporter n=1 Tax=Halosquirtibacter laminarini TaxID=3374600 RepID=A0AC61NCX6_9BACT|nr:cation diffusion facilitator family transporter [Prolixibacteraceae bacterium]
MEYNKERTVSLAGFISIIGNIILFAVKYWAGIVSGSIAIIADAWHTLSDSISSIFVILGAKVAAKPADEEHPFGHGRFEHITSIIIGMMLAAIGFEFIIESIKKLSDGGTTEYGMVAKVVTVVSILGKELMAQMSFFLGKKVNSRVLKADGWHHRSDALTSIIILVGIFFSGYFWWIDGVLGILVALMIFYTSYSIIKEETNALLGEVPDKAVVARIKTIAAEETKREVFMHHFHIHQYGDHTEITCHIKLPANSSLFYTHKVCNKIERRVLSELNMEMTIHPEPMEEKEYDWL